MTYPSRIIGWPRFIHPGWKIMLDAGRFPFYAARFTAASGLYTDTALTVPAASYGDAVAGWRGAGLIGVQPTLTARPAYGRMPVSGVRNLLANVESAPGSEDVGWAGWDRYGLTAPTADGTLDGKPANRMDVTTGTQFRYVRFNATGVTGWASFAVDVTGMTTKVVVFEFGGAGVGAGTARFTWTGPQSITTVNSGSGNIQDSYYEILGDYQAILHSRVAIPIPNNLALLVGAYASYTSAGGEYFRATRAMLSEGVIEQPYQKVTAPYDVTESGVPDTPILYYDLGDDVLPAAMELPEVTGGTLVIAGEKGVWIDDSFSHAGGSWSLGPTTYTGGPNGLLPNLVGNRVLGFAVFAGQLTPEQLQVEVAYWMAKGAPGVWEVGADAWTDPPTHVGAGWTDNTGGSYTHANGGGTTPLRMGGVLSPGDTFISGYTISGRTTGAVNSQVTSGATLRGISTNATYRDIGVFVSGYGFYPNTPFDGTVSAISWQPLTLNTDP